MADITKKYINEDITIVWKPNMCIHSTKCWKGESGLRNVFDPTQKPWIKPEGAAASEIIKRINSCPSKALSFYYNDESKNVESASVENVVEALPNGPLLVYGNLKVKLKDGSENQKNNVTAFCRCGASSNKPYCDGTHVKIEFKD